jgi:type II secretory pathway pseudopilin PulG
MIEMMAVLMIVGIMLLAIIPSIDGLVPKYRIRGAAREIAALIEEAQSQSIAQRKEFQVAYDLDSKQFWLVLPPRDPNDPVDGSSSPPPAATEPDPAADPKLAGFRPADDVEHGPPARDPAATDATQSEEQTVAERETTSPKDLPAGVLFERVSVGDDDKQSGTVHVPFEHLGASGSHVVGLKLQEGELQIWVKFNALTRTIEFSDEQPTVRTLDGEQ